MRTPLGGGVCRKSVRKRRHLHFEGDFGQHFISFPDFFMTEYASLSKYLSKNVQVVIQVVNNKKGIAKTPREANLDGNWCVRKGLKSQCREDMHEDSHFASHLALLAKAHIHGAVDLDCSVSTVAAGRKGSL